MKPKLPTLWWMTDEARVSDPRPFVGRLPRGSAVILRHYGARATLAADLAALCRRHGLILSVSGDWRLAAKVGAHALHLPEHQAHRGPAPGARLWLRHGRLLTAAAHGPRGLRRAATIGADAALLSPLFTTASHAEAKGLGLTRAALMLRNIGLPVMALGGVTRRQANALHRRGFAGMAGIGFLRAR